MSSAKIINRITLFKIPEVSNQEKLLAVYKNLQQDARKDGNPYILSLRAGYAIPDQRAQGYTVAVFSTFASKEDMQYYDNDCGAHKALKLIAKEVHQGVMMVYFESIFD